MEANGWVFFVKEWRRCTKILLCCSAISPRILDSRDWEYSSNFSRYLSLVKLDTYRSLDMAIASSIVNYTRWPISSCLPSWWIKIYIFQSGFKFSPYGVLLLPSPNNNSNADSCLLACARWSCLFTLFYSYYSCLLPQETVPTGSFNIKFLIPFSHARYWSLAATKQAASRSRSAIHKIN